MAQIGGKRQAGQQAARSTRWQRCQRYHGSTVTVSPRDPAHVNPDPWPKRRGSEEEHHGITLGCLQQEGRKAEPEAGAMR